MALLPQPVVDYSDKDFDSIRVRLYNLISAVFPDWTDQNVANFGNILVELFAHVGDTLGFYLDNHALESRIVTATQRRSLLALSKLVGFVPFGATPAQADVVVTLLNGPLAADVIIPANTIARTLAVTDPISFQVLSDITLPAGATQGVGTVENSRSHVETFSATGVQFQELELQNTPFLEAGLTVVGSNGSYTVVDDFLSATAADRHVQIIVDQNERATLRFGNGVNGQLPTGTVQVDYKTGGGANGNVDPTTITRLEGSFTDALSNPAQLSISNPNGAAGGADRQSIEQIRLQAPASIRSLNRSITREDYETNALRVPQVARAIMITSNERPGVPENTGMLHIVPQGGGLPSQAVQAAVLTMVTETFPGPLTFLVSVENPEYLPVDVNATVFLQRGALAATVDASIRANLTNFFAVNLADGSPNPLIGFGADFLDVSGNPTGELAFSDIYNVVRDTAGVRKIGDTAGNFFLNGNASDVDIEPQEFPRLGTVTIINGDTGAALV